MGRNKGVLTNKAVVNNSNNRKAKAYITALLSQQLNYSQIAEQLNSNGFLTSPGKQFQTVQVQRLIN
jgi:hypothetical protein